jgi:hypothetical protein
MNSGQRWKKTTREKKKKKKRRQIDNGKKKKKPTHIHHAKKKKKKKHPAERAPGRRNCIDRAAATATHVPRGGLGTV